MSLNTRRMLFAHIWVLSKLDAHCRVSTSLVFALSFHLLWLHRVVPLVFLRNTHPLIGYVNSNPPTFTPPGSGDARQHSISAIQISCPRRRAGRVLERR